ncbi:eukaryotic translation initiation factor subunit eIF2B-gamma [Aspergillus niger ATCC 13496]|uniref:Translation initiation factor eIF2B subunit gamma n=1 Tax=Aspergillus niger ATCC 13496 TaxID=1353008 RepID=A0A370BZ02_ASPNG|nr:eukaryotic translation initiation factor subunit eIF2B-gamma [Aspergillus niger CBS 513.88]RDH19295.1 eukaryotic translation initiation factor subunit eIF2B-gamma [Aspergillus niger ATCC 13496]|eukprot:XP_001390910.2 eukaryotic translation initiation factor subunit eIF2B-gamma [Aspergillus niger CBS 513.88]
MPSSAPVPATGFQALILCGPGVSLNTFTSNPEEYPKSLIPIANRPMVFYPIDFCKRSGITDITLITPPSSLGPLQAALKQNPHLTSLPAPSVSVVAPKDLEMTMGTAELLRLPEVQECIKTDFLLLPCDLICDIPGESILEAWLVTQGALGGNSDGPGGEQGGRRGGLAVYYQTLGREESVKGEATDFVAVAPLGQDEAPVVSHLVDGPSALRFGLSKLLMSMPMDTVKERMEQEKGFLVRHALVQKYAQVKMLTSYRDAHLYVFPYWVKDLARHQEKLESVSEDLIGYWAKAGWQKGLGDKLGMNKIFHDQSQHDNKSHDGDLVEDEIDLNNISSTKVGSPASQAVEHPQILAYVQQGSTPFVRRVDSSAILLSTSLRLAKLDSIEEVGRQAASPFAHSQKVAHPEGVAQRCTVTKSDCLLAENVTVEPTCVIKESVIGPNCHISSGARLTRCVVMDGAVVESRAQLTGCLIGRRARIGRECVLKDCEVQDANVVPEETDAKNEKFMVFEGLDDEGDEGMDDMDEFDG